ncbi:NADPH-dependent reductase BacG [Rhodobacteraceae bacterium IMCC1933]|nr:NADPH-dependent reductase BacG [Rhodobacteraceae bacterium IMCC1923]MDP4068567.1 NADPH-dependent reductase BacG [Rhodobacteraceae bacterium IMCC1933]MDP4070294.1 NADPH-dependent reductase BacG [Rhodobacteraceae bacterium IMCC1909]
MDLDIAGRKALLCASNAGLGLACAKAVAAEGVDVVINGRNPEKIRAAQAEVEAVARGRVSAVQADVSTEEGRAALLAACPDADILLNNNAGPKPKRFLDTKRQDWEETYHSNYLAPILLVHAVIPGMIERGFGRIINITSAMVTTPRPHLTLSAGARAGLTASLKALSFEVAPHNVTINNMLPERIDSPRQIEMAYAVMKRDGLTFEEARAAQVQSIAAKRLGRPEEFGAMFAFLCSSYAGYISGSNMHLDGGSYPGLV